MNTTDAQLDPQSLLTLDAPPFGEGRVYAISFDLDTDTLRERYPSPSSNNAYADIRRIFTEEGFIWQQGSVYFGDPAKIDAVRCVLAAQRLGRELPWFNASVRDIRMLRIEDNNDLGPAMTTAR
ncbi:MAG: virulence factor [Vulcanimicrobiaceae bacterium]